MLRSTDSQPWPIIRAQRLEDVNNRCEKCRKYSTTLQAHHFHPRSRCPKDVRDIYDNCIILCGGGDGCHDKAHSYQKGYEELVYRIKYYEGRNAAACLRDWRATNGLPLGGE